MNNYQEVLKQIGHAFRIERTKQNLSQEKFAEKAQVHTNYIGKVERGEQNLTIRGCGKSRKMTIFRTFSNPTQGV